MWHNQTLMTCTFYIITYWLYTAVKVTLYWSLQRHICKCMNTGRTAELHFVGNEFSDSQNCWKRCESVTITESSLLFWLNLRCLQEKEFASKPKKISFWKSNCISSCSYARNKDYVFGLFSAWAGTYILTCVYIAFETLTRVERD